VLGEDAQAKGWTADELPAPGVALVRDGKRKPHPVSVRYMDKKQVIALPDRPIWQGPEPEDGPKLSLVKEEAAVPAPRTTPAGAVSNRDRVLQAVRDGARTPKAVTDATGLNKGTVSKAVKALVASGALLRSEDGTLAAGEVSA
jgi:S-DNA-T family DNA segregation ATPase FtsK/SpoIIIE